MLIARPTVSPPRQRMIEDMRMRKLSDTELIVLEVADVFRLHGPAWRQTAHLSLGQLQVMSAIERCRTAALGGHVLRCAGFAKLEVAYNSCRNRHCPSVRPMLPGAGSTQAATTSSPLSTTTSCSPCPRLSAPSPGTTRR